MACSMVGQLVRLAAISEKEKPAAGCMSATQAAMPVKVERISTCLTAGWQPETQRALLHRLPPREASPPPHDHAAWRESATMLAALVMCRMSDVYVLCHIGQLPGLVCRPWTRHPRQGIGEGLVVRENVKPATIQQILEVSDAGVADESSLSQ